MQISGFKLNSFVDYKENIASVIFVGGCNFRCEYCHNMHVVEGQDSLNLAEIIKTIRMRKNFLDAVVISGGEPTLCDFDKLFGLITSIKEIGLMVKLDTNGTNFDMLCRLSPHLDYVAMDIKAPLDKYHLVTKITPIQLENIKKSIQFLKNREAEFRTTVIPELGLDDIEEIARLICGGRAKYYLQPVNHTDTYTKPLHSPDFFKKAKERADAFVKTFIR